MSQRVDWLTVFCAALLMVSSGCGRKSEEEKLPKARKPAEAATPRKSVEPAGESKKATNPLAISWEGDIGKPVRLTDAPAIQYEWADSPLLKEVTYVAKVRGKRDGKIVTRIMPGYQPFAVAQKRGSISGKDWSLGFGLSLAMWGARGEGTIEIAFFEPLAEGQEKELKDRRQMSNWLVLPIDLGS